MKKKIKKLYKINHYGILIKHYLINLILIFNLFKIILILLENSCSQMKLIN